MFIGFREKNDKVFSSLWTVLPLRLDSVLLGFQGNPPARRAFSPVTGLLLLVTSKPWFVLQWWVLHEYACAKKTPSFWQLYSCWLSMSTTLYKVQYHSSRLCPLQTASLSFHHVESRMLNTIHHLLKIYSKIATCTHAAHNINIWVNPA